MSRIISVFSAFIGMCSSGTRKTYIIENLYQFDDAALTDFNETNLQVLTWPR